MSTGQGVADIVCSRSSYPNDDGSLAGIFKRPGCKAIPMSCFFTCSCAFESFPICTHKIFLRLMMCWFESSWTANLSAAMHHYSGLCLPVPLKKFPRHFVFVFLGDVWGLPWCLFQRQSLYFFQESDKDLSLCFDFYLTHCILISTGI